jgi:hypothetical protein
MSKCFVVFLGAGSSGKTTARKAICGEPVRIDRKKVGDLTQFMTVYENYAVAGNHNSGSDANAAPHLIVNSAKEAFQERDIVFFDGVMGSPRLLEVPEAVDCSVLLVHFNLSQEEVYKRLLGRRRNSGKFVESELPEKTFKNAIEFIRRATNTLAHFEQKCKRPTLKVEINDNHDQSQVVEIIKSGIEQCLSMPTVQSFLHPTLSPSSSGVRKIRLSK